MPGVTFVTIHLTLISARGRLEEQGSVSGIPFSLPYRRRGSWTSGRSLTSFSSRAEESRYVQYRRRIQMTNPERYQSMKMKQRECMKKLRAKRKVERMQIEQILRNQPFALNEAGASLQGDGAREQDEHTST